MGCTASRTFSSTFARARFSTLPVYNSKNIHIYVSTPLSGERAHFCILCVKKLAKTVKNSSRYCHLKFWVFVRSVSVYNNCFNLLLRAAIFAKTLAE